LLIDDNQESLQMLSTALAGSGATVVNPAAGFNAHLAKPVDPIALIQCVLECRQAWPP